MYKKYLVSLFAIALPLSLCAQVKAIPTGKDNIEKSFTNNAVIASKLETSKSVQDIDAEVMAKIKSFNLDEAVKNIKLTTKVKPLPRTMVPMGQRMKIRRSVESMNDAADEKREKTELLSDINEAFKGLPSKYQVKGTDLSNKKLFLAQVNLSLAYVEVGNYKKAKNLLKEI